MKHLPKVYILDTDLALHKSLEALLSSQGYWVKCFTSAADFIAQHHPIQVGCMLIDLTMVGVEGREVLRHLHESGSLLSVVITSGLLDDEAFDRPEGALAELLDKPYEVATLLTMIKDAVAGSFRRRAERAGGFHDDHL